MSYRIKTVAEMLGVPRNTLIAWERRLGILAPNRSEGGYRVYSADDVATLQRLKELMDSGLKVSEAWALMRQDQAEVHLARAASSAPDTLREELTAALLAWDRGKADAIAGRLLGVSFETQIDELLLPMLEDVGNRWAEGRVSIAQEHHISGWCRERLHLMLHTLQVNQRSGPQVTCATPAGEHHDLGLLALAVKLGLRGFRVLWLGASLPTVELVRQVEEHTPFGMCLSMVQRRPVEEVARWARELRRRVHPSVRIAIGGPATVDIPDHEAPGVNFCGRELPPWTEGARAGLAHP